MIHEANKRPNEGPKTLFRRQPFQATGSCKVLQTAPLYQAAVCAEEGFPDIVPAGDWIKRSKEAEWSGVWAVLGSRRDPATAQMHSPPHAGPVLRRTTPIGISSSFMSGGLCCGAFLIATKSCSMRVLFDFITQFMLSFTEHQQFIVPVLVIGKSQ